MDEVALEVDRLAERVQRVGEEIGLPCIAASADIGSPEPMRNSRGEPFVETLFRWVDPDLRYWEDRGAERFGVAAAIITLAYLPGGVIGAVVWATADSSFDVEPVFKHNAPELQSLALHFVAADHDTTRQADSAPVQLTSREIQCLKWGAAGKTDSEISLIMSISVPTMRFHMTNAAGKLGVTGRSQAICRAATLGYVGSAPAAH